MDSQFPKSLAIIYLFLPFYYCFILIRAVSLHSLPLLKLPSLSYIPKPKPLLVTQVILDILQGRKFQVGGLEVRFHNSTLPIYQHTNSHVRSILNKCIQGPRYLEMCVEFDNGWEKGQRYQNGRANTNGNGFFFSR